MSEEIKAAEATEKETIETIKEKLQKEIEERKIKRKEASEVIAQGKGVLALEKPIKAEDKEITELPYDFTELTGMEYTEAMDSDINAQQIFKMTYRQGLALFARAAAKQIPELDMRDIVERMGVTDAVQGVQLATLFFTASTKAGQMRLSKRQ